MVKTGLDVANLVRFFIVVSALLMLGGRVSYEAASTIGLGLILSLPWVMIMYYSQGLGKREFLASVALALFFPVYALLLTLGLLP